MSLPEEQSRLDTLQNRLYAKNTPLRRRERSKMSATTVSGQDTFAPIDKTESPKHKKLPPTFFKKIFLSSLIICILALVFGGYMWWQGKRTVSSDRIEISVAGNSFTEGGEGLSLDVEIQNKNSAELELADLVIEYAKSGVDGNSKESVRISVGNVGGGKRITVPVSVTLYGEEGSVQPIDLRLEYRIAGSNSVFVKNVTHTITLSSSPIGLFVDAPSSIPPNQEIMLDIVLKHDADNVAQSIGLQVEYPFGFQFTSAIPEPIKGNNVFSLGDLPKGAERHVQIRGTMFGEIGEKRAFRIYTGAIDPLNETTLSVIYASIVHSLTLEKPFLEAELSYNNKTSSEFTIKPGENVTATVKWSNNLPIKMNNVELHVKLSGTAFNPSSVVPQNYGFFDSETNTIIWSGGTYKNLLSVDPGEKGEVRFSFTPITQTGSTTIENPSINTAVSIKGNQSTSNNAPEEISTIEEKTFKVITDLRLSGRSLFHTGSIFNTGLLPPVVGQSTPYTVVWSITNTTNQTTDTIVKATLPIYMQWGSVVFPATENLTYNTATREILWQPGNIAPHTGGSSSPKEVSFTVLLKPSTSQVNTSPIIITNATLTSRDNFTGALLQSSWPALTTKLTTDNPALVSEWTVQN